MTLQLSRRDIFRYTAVGLGSAALLGGVTGCVANAPAAVATASAATNFDFVSFSLSQATTTPVLQAAIDSFASKKGVKVTASSYPFNSYLTQLILQVRGNQFSGAAQMPPEWLASIAALGKLVDLSDLVKGRGYTDAALAMGQYHGKQLGLPWYTGSIGLITNKELLSKAGASAQPKTLTEFEDNLRALKGIGVIPYAATTKADVGKDILLWMQTFGSPVIENGKSTIGDDASVAAMTWYKKLFDDGLIAPDVDRSAARTLFAQEKTAIYEDASVGKAGDISTSPDSGLGDKMAPIGRPVLSTGDTPQEVLWGALMVVVAGEGSGTAAEFSQWITSDKTQTVDYSHKLDLPPSTTAALNAPVIKADTWISEFTDRVTVHAKRSPIWPYVQSLQMQTAIAEQVQAALVGKSSPAEAMKAAGKAVTGLIS